LDERHSRSKTFQVAQSVMALVRPVRKHCLRVHMLSFPHYDIVYIIFAKYAR